MANKQRLSKRKRLELERRRRQQRRNVGFVATVVALVVLVIVAIAASRPGSKPSSRPTATPTPSPVNFSILPGLQSGPAPWSTDLPTLTPRLQALGLPPLPSEGTVLHIHQHLDIFVNGHRVTVPASIGISTLGGGVFFSPLHTHDTSGIVHVESATVREFTLGEFFGVWGVKLSSNCIGGYCNKGGSTLRAFVDGRPVAGDPADIPLLSHEEIVLAYGTKNRLPNPIPKSYKFPAGE